MTHVTAAVLDLVNIFGGLMLAVALLVQLPRVGPWIARAAAAAARATLVIGVVALVAGGYYLIIHLTSGPHVFHFELVGIGVGVALLRDRLFPRTASQQAGQAISQQAGQVTASQQAGQGWLTTPVARAEDQGRDELLLAVFGLIAFVVGIQGLGTLDG